jgi:hypothetical protein
VCAPGRATGGQVKARKQDGVAEAALVHGRLERAGALGELNIERLQIRETSRV